jgi:hypothetical protein
MSASIAAWVLTACLEGNIMCVRGKAPAIKYYETGKSCYIEGVFHQSCPKMDYLK